MKNTSLEHILFLDIETVGIVQSYNQLNERMRQLWDKKAERLRDTAEQTPEESYKKAGIYAEFGKVICISVAFLKDDKLRIKSFCNEDELVLLENFAGLLNTYFSKNHHRL